MSDLRSRLINLAKAKRAYRIKLEREALSGNLVGFMREAWPCVEPGKEYMHNWHIDAIADHLQAVTNRQIKRLLINVPFRTSKSTLVSVMWPAWTWTFNPEHQFLCGSYAAKLAIRDSVKHRRLTQTKWYQERWGDKFGFTDDQNQKIRFENDKAGYRISFGFDSGVMGDGADTIIIDDPMDRNQAHSDKERENALETFDEAIITRLNEPAESAIVVIMQRLHQDDLSGHLIKQGGYEHLMLPMSFDDTRRCHTVLGFTDPRTEDGELLWPDRFPLKVVQDLTVRLGPAGASGQLQQSPTPRGGNIIKDEWWGTYELEIGASPKHHFDFKIASLDPAYTSKEENDPSGFTIWGTYLDKGQVKIVLLHAWQKRLELHGQTMERLPNEKNDQYVRRTSPHWGLVEWVAHDCTRLRVNMLLIEDKASGHSVAQEIQRLYGNREWGVQLRNPGALDKRARVYSIQHLFSAGMIEAPASTSGDLMVFREWAQMVIDEFSRFRGLPGDVDNLVDASSQALIYLRDTGIAIRREEKQFMEDELARYKPPSQPIYDV